MLPDALPPACAPSKFTSENRHGPGLGGHFRMTSRSAVDPPNISKLNVRW